MICISRKLQRFLVVFLLAIPLPLFAAAGKVVIAAGEVFAINAQQEQRPLQRRSDIFEGDTLVTGPDGQLQLRFEDNAILALRSDSQLRISEYHGASDSQPERVLMDLLGGGFRTISGSFGKSERDAYQVRTPTASIGIRGTHYEAVFQSATLTVGVYEGGIVLTNERGSLNLGLDSEFVFAQVQAGNLPQGLLNPPANLNVPNTPQGEPGGEEEEEGGEEENDDSDVSETNTETPGDGPDNGVITALQDNNLSADDFNLTSLEDAFIELQQKSVTLSQAERVALLNTEVTSVGILVMAPSDTGNNGQALSENGPIIAYASSYPTGVESSQPFFVAYEDQSTNNNLSNLPNFVLRPTENYPTDENYFGQSPIPFPWEEWDYNGLTSGPAGTANAGSNTGFNSGVVDEPFFYVSVEPMQAKLIADADFMLSGLVTNFSEIDMDNETSFLHINIEDLTTSGLINFTSYQDQETMDWSLAFDGNVTGNTLSGALNNGSTLFTDDQQTFGLNGNVTGILTGEPGGLGVVGGFTAESTGSNHEAYGVFQMQEVGEGEVDLPCNPQIEQC